MDSRALLKDLIVEKLENAPGKAIVAEGYEDLLKRLDLADKVSVTKLREALGSLNFSDRRIKVIPAERAHLSDQSPRKISVSLRRL